jgi:hypothetical protein
VGGVPEALDIVIRDSGAQRGKQLSRVIGKLRYETGDKSVTPEAFQIGECTPVDQSLNLRRRNTICQGDGRVFDVLHLNDLRTAQDAVNNIQEPRWLDRLRHIAIHSCLSTASPRICGCIGGEGDDGHVWLSDTGKSIQLGRFDAVHDRHVQIHQNQIEVVLLERVERRFTVIHHCRGMPHSLQSLRNHHLIRTVALGNQNRKRPCGWSEDFSLLSIGPKDIVRDRRSDLGIDGSVNRLVVDDDDCAHVNSSCHSLGGTRAINGSHG